VLSFQREDKVMHSAPVSEEPRKRGLSSGTGLSRRQCISRSNIFQEAFKQGRPYVGKFIVMRLRKGEDAHLSLGVIASKRTFRRSVDRSRAKRLLRESYRLNRCKFDDGQDIVLVARRAILGVKRQEVDKDLLKVAEKSGIFRRS
jgi:ribonuclease P protein component